MNKIPIKQYKNLKPGAKYIFKTYHENGHRIRDGLLIYVSTKLDTKVDDKGKVIKSTLVGDQLQFEPLGDNAYTDFNGEKLKTYSITVYRGSFEIFETDKII